TIVNSRGDDLPNGGGVGGGGRNPTKMDSPELQPLPPLARQGSRRLYDEGVNAGEDEEEEFYSPRGSLNGI
ncbi:formin-like 2 domain protein, partial [Trifolium medium]|nr:formin-like 2 domain protein [Trifolium medium]